MSSAIFELQLVNQDSHHVPSDRVWVSLLGTDPTTGEFGYLDFARGVMVTGPSFTYVSGTTSRTLAELQALGATLPIPAVASARLYFAIGQDFSSMPASGPPPGRETTVQYDKIELDTAGTPNINGTSVDFYGISYTIEGTPAGGGGPVTVGFTTPRTRVIGELLAAARAPLHQHSGNDRIFPACGMSGPGGVLRVLSPKAMALTDWARTREEELLLATQCSHFFDAYVSQHCWRPGREFSFYDKLYPAQLNARYGRVSDDGTTLMLYTDAARTVPYAPVPFLARPCAPWPKPSFETPTNYHRTSSTSVDGIDWGFLLIGNAGGAGLGAPWATDPAAMAIMMSIVRGVMHHDDGMRVWVHPKAYYRGLDGRSTEDLPILRYAQVLHALGLGGRAYALSLDDVYGQNPSLFMAPGSTVIVTLTSLEPVVPDAL